MRGRGTPCLIAETFPFFLVQYELMFISISQQEALPKKFTCLFCNHEEAVTVSLDKKAGVGQLDCAVCGQTFQCAINCTCSTGNCGLDYAPQRH